MDKDNSENTETGDGKQARLNNTRQVKRFMQRIINEYNNNLISTEKAKTLSTLINSYIKIFELLATDTQKQTGIELTKEQEIEILKQMIYDSPELKEVIRKEFFKEGESYH